jgi:nucleoside-triphosphatase
MQVYLLTGRPGSGKTSLIKQVIAQMEGRAGGFYTEEIRTRGIREGFRLITLDGEEMILAHVNIRSSYRVSKYGVDVNGFERLGVAALQQAAAQRDLIVIDEIGKMELFSTKFREIVSQLIDAGKKILATIMLAPNPWADAIKSRPQIKLITVNRENHRQVLTELLNWLKIARSPIV